MPARLSNITPPHSLSDEWSNLLYQGIHIEGKKGSHMGVDVLLLRTDGGLEHSHLSIPTYQFEWVSLVTILSMPSGNSIRNCRHLYVHIYRKVVCREITSDTVEKEGWQAPLATDIVSPGFRHACAQWYAMLPPGMPP